LIEALNFAPRLTKDMSNITFTMIKPDAVANGHSGKIIDQILEAGFSIQAMKYLHLTPENAGKFYAVHRERPFFNDLVSFMTSGPIFAAVLVKENAVADFRTLIGATDPKKADVGTIRQRFADSIEANAVHGSDSDENAAIEASFFFNSFERF
jgi:nucleoside-diphosphate kinase